MRLLIFFWLTARRLRPSFWQVKPAAACRSFGPCRRWISTAPRSAGHQLSSQPPAPPGAPQTRSWRAVTRPKSWNRWLAGTGELRVGGGEGFSICTVYENTLPSHLHQTPKATRLLASVARRTSHSSVGLSSRRSWPVAGAASSLHACLRALCRSPCAQGWQKYLGRTPR